MKKYLTTEQINNNYDPELEEILNTVETYDNKDPMELKEEDFQKNLYQIVIKNYNITISLKYKKWSKLFHLLNLNALKINELDQIEKILQLLITRKLEPHVIQGLKLYLEQVQHTKQNATTHTNYNNN